MTHYVISVFEENRAIDKAVSALRQAGVSDESMTLLASAEAAEVAEIVGVEPDNAALEGALAGTGIGGALGALGAVALVALPGIGTILASGLVATLSGSVLGGYLGTLYGMRAETHEVIDMKNQVTPDSIILIVQAQDEATAESYLTLLEKEGSEWAEVIADEDEAAA